MPLQTQYYGIDFDPESNELQWHWRDIPHARKVPTDMAPSQFANELVNSKLISPESYIGYNPNIRKCN